MNQLAVICDDLTGAMEAGLQLFKKGFPAYVIILTRVLGHAHFEGLRQNSAAAFIIDTESRNVSRDEAASRIQAAWRGIAQAGFRLVYKKVDSTLRGNLGREMEVILQQAEFEMMVFVPALPFNGRTTKKGYHYLGGSKLTESDLAKDPFAPIHDSYIPNVLTQQTSVPTVVVSLEEIRKGADFLESWFRELHFRGCQIAIVDAETEDDLRIISAALAKSSLRLLPCGSAGLFAKMTLPAAQNVAILSTSSRHQANGSSRAVLIISGSPAKVTKQQIQNGAKHDLPVIRLAPHMLIKSFWTRKEVDAVIQKAVSYLKRGESVIIDGAGEGKEEITAQYGKSRRRLQKDSQRIQNQLSRVFKKVVTGTEIAGVMVIGGDTLNRVCQKMQAKAIRITNEVEAFIPAGEMMLKQNQIIPIVSKAGGFGSEDIIMKVIQYFSSQTEARKEM